MFAGGVRFHTAVVFLIQVVVVPCVIFIHSFSDVVGIGPEYYISVRTGAYPRFW